ncbi:nitroreductase family protein [Streptomyces sp. ISL-10]|uniref:nitroreductase family protein n=1 Tax=Streptomyces sp. ISL-10 TaxID=2819172 RepID=UPI001BECC712|nr:nitroreductase family protein [Streptomyces sp. ISL-10]MBT2365428.1 nitroreductase family protein [Streptomyces sp. ISL-10]
MPLIDINQLTEDLLHTGAAQPTGVFAGPATPPPLPGDPVQALRTRSAVRQWASGPMEVGTLARVLQYACEQDDRIWKPAFPTLPTPTAAVLARRVGGLPDGYYHYDPGREALVRQAQPMPPAEELVLQLEFAQAPVLVLALGDLAQATGRHGASGHRLLLARGAALAHAMWLAALSRGAVGTVFAGVLNAAGRTELGIDGFHQAQLLGLALGEPRSNEPPAREGR